MRRSDQYSGSCPRARASAGTRCRAPRRGMRVGGSADRGVGSRRRAAATVLAFPIRYVRASPGGECGRGSIWLPPRRLRHGHVRYEELERLRRLHPSAWRPVSTTRRAARVRRSHHRAEQALGRVVKAHLLGQLFGVERPALGDTDRLRCRCIAGRSSSIWIRESCGGWPGTGSWKATTSRSQPAPAVSSSRLNQNVQHGRHRASAASSAEPCPTRGDHRRHRRDLARRRRRLWKELGGACSSARRMAVVAATIASAGSRPSDDARNTRDLRKGGSRFSFPSWRKRSSQRPDLVEPDAVDLPRARAAASSPDGRDCGNWHGHPGGGRDPAHRRPPRARGSNSRSS